MTSDLERIRTLASRASAERELGRKESLRTAALDAEKDLPSWLRKIEAAISEGEHRVFYPVPHKEGYDTKLQELLGNTFCVLMISQGSFGSLYNVSVSW